MKKGECALKQPLTAFTYSTSSPTLVKIISHTHAKVSAYSSSTYREYCLYTLMTLAMNASIWKIFF